MTKAEQVRLTAWRLRVLRQAADEGNVARVCRRFGISRKSFYKWKRRHAEHGNAGLCDRPRPRQWHANPWTGVHEATCTGS
jgi:transposase-like protein